MHPVRMTLGVLVVVCAWGITQATAEPKPGKEGARPERGDRFAAMDTDGDGKISLAEFAVSHEKRQQARKEQMGDRWDAERAAKAPTAAMRFTKLDTDSDGYLSKEEFRDGNRQYREAQREREKARDGKGPREGGKGKKPAAE